MAIRLYPNTKNPAVIERLLAVPVGTAARHAAIEASFKATKAALNEGFNDLTDEQQWERRDEYRNISQREWNAMNDDDDDAVAKYEVFQTYGWGRVNRLCEDYCGGETDPVKVDAILQEQGVSLNGVTLEELEGVHWC